VLPLSNDHGVIERIARLGVVPVVELGSVEQAAPLVEALMAAGLPAVEITLRTDAGLAAIERVRGAYPDVLVGAGTVRSLQDTCRVLNAGCQFVVSPATDVEQIDLCLSSGVLPLPGTSTPTEVHTAVRAGVRVVKFFPAEAMGGVALLRALAAPYRDVRFLPTGGITAANLTGYLRMPQVVACGGSWMVARSLLDEGRFVEVEDLARAALRIVEEVRGDG